MKAGQLPCLFVFTMSVNLFSPSEVTELLIRHGLRPKKRLGQNFLIDRNVLNKIVGAADLTADSYALEVGPGLGTLTRELAAIAKKVVGVEADRDLIPVLSETLEDYNNIEIVHGDFLKLDLTEFLSEKFGDNKLTVVANLPYYITTPLITSFIAAKSHLNRMVVMVQQEVAQRMAAAPGTSDYGSITVFVQYHCKVSIAAKIKRTVFYPPPDVDSAVLRLDIRQEPPVDVKDEAVFFNIVRASFGQRRKTLLKALSGSPNLGWSKEKSSETLAKAGIDHTRRGETLSLEEFATIANAAI